ncbi:putative lipoprotein [Leptospira ryugenii]|uniref:Putative lipoprotein n=1 Tax=Leptospira ryugenii TaxID=1917863 RepID=A0A2P2E1H5_9LEPT|nr:hypothetical protein [Leptospira ryugenii]GBF50731.1 putative lipoprotein [Leptospira ryugenii]
MLRLIFVCITVLASFLACKNLVFVREYKPKLNDFSPKAKIALVGFYPYSYSSYTSGRVTTTTAVLDYKNPTSSLLSIGKPIDTIPSTGFDTSVSSELAKEVATNYLGKVKISGFAEISKMIEIKKVGENMTYSLKRRDVDYYLIAIHGPAFDDHLGNVGRILLTAHLCIATIGTVPCWSSMATESQFLLYDKKLNLIDSKSFTNRYEHLGAWWGREDQGDFNLQTMEVADSLKVGVYKPQILEYEDYLKELLNK